MSLVSDADILEFMDTQEEYFTVSASSDGLIFAYDSGVAQTVDIPDGTYSGVSLATAAQTALNTAFTISCTVSWSPTTRLFTFTAPAGHTFTYTHTGSEAGPLFGFNQSHAAALTITSDEVAGSPSAMILDFRDAAEDWIENYCRRTFTSTTYTLEKYNGTGSKYLYLKNYPVTAISLLSVGTRDALYLYNTNDVAYASVSVSSTGITLSKSGAADIPITFAASTTIGAVVTAINAAGGGWTAAISSSDYTSYASTILLPRFGASAVDSSYVYLQMPNEAESDFEIDENNGIVMLNGGVPLGFKNIFISYVAGFTTIPSDLALAIKVFTKALYDKKSQESWNIESYSVGDVKYKFNALSDAKGGVALAMPIEVMDILSKYRKRKI